MGGSLPGDFVTDPFYSPHKSTANPRPRYGQPISGNGDLAVDISDPVYALDYLFNNGVPPVPLESAEINGDGEVNIADVVALLEFLFNNGPPPPAPFPDIGCP